MVRKTFFIIAAICASSPAFALAAGTVTINPNIPGTNAVSATSGPGAFVANFYQFALLIAGILALGAIVYGGVKYSASAGNPSAQSDGKEWILSALYGLILLAGAYLILYTINPNLTNLNLPVLQPVNISTPPPNATSTNALCTDLPGLATGNNVPYPAQNSPELNTLIACVHQHVSFSATTFTYDQDHPTCNYTRGQAVCESACSHARFSCHYGGHSGSAGAQAVDLDVVGGQGLAVVNAAVQYCGIPQAKARCEAANGVTVPCTAGATHVHLDTASCDSN